MTDYISRLSRTLNAIQSANVTTKPQTVRGTISGSMVNIDGVKYPYETTTDILTVDGLSVWCQISGDRAVILGA